MRPSDETNMMSRLVLVIAPVVLWSSGACAQAADVTACDTLLAARRVDAAAGSDHQGPSEAGCRRIARREIGTVEQRAMIGGAPYECMTVAGAGRCLWIVP
jgi:hypothetical protein